MFTFLSQGLDFRSCRSTASVLLQIGFGFARYPSRPIRSAWLYRIPTSRLSNFKIIANESEMPEVLLRIKGLTLRRDDGTGSAILNVRSP